MSYFGKVFHMYIDPCYITVHLAIQNFYHV